ncbi:MAG: acetoacetate metabolism regulatory protein AtoC [Candidatus Binatia bacterium]|nr:MAG: acetoacetate metabolism regulatory protein AtoC [Candidatus Binatia bacterium]
MEPKSEPETPRSQAAPRGTILVADDEAGIRESLAEVLREEGYDVVAVGDGEAALRALEERDFDVVLSDLLMPGADGLEVLERVRERSPQTLTLLMTAHASVDTAVQALRRGAQDYLLKPLLFDEVLHKVEALLQHRQIAWENQFLRSQLHRRWDVDEVVARSPAMQQVMELARKVAATSSTVLLTGESGVGKEVVARAIHRMSERRDRVFLPVNCAAIPETLLESQLFGHLRGSFTGAVTNQEGLFQRARGGTIFLDEIADLPLGLQAKLLRVIESKEILPIGASAPTRVDVRILAATNRDLAREVEEGRFRADLFYRLNVVNIHIPPLRERREDIPPLVDHLVRLHNRELKKSFQGLDRQALQVLMSLPWKGNVRELDNVIEHAMILGEGDWIGVEDLPSWVRRDLPPSVGEGTGLREAVRAYEKAYIEATLRQTGNDKRLAAKQLGLSLSSLYRKLEELGIRAPARQERG